MSYGISIQNVSQKIIVDSNQGYPAFYCVNPGGDTIVNANGDLTPYLVNGELIFARPDGNNGIISFAAEAQQLYLEGASSARLRRFKSVLDGGFTIPTTGYGINVYNSAGSGIFAGSSAQFSVNFDIFLHGFWPSTITVDPEWKPMTTSSTSLANGRTYVLLNSGQYYSHIGEGEKSWIQEYTFDTARSTYGSIGVSSYTKAFNGFDADGDPIDTYTTYITNTSWVIGYIRGI